MQDLQKHLNSSDMMNSNRKVGGHSNLNLMLTVKKSVDLGMTSEHFHYSLFFGFLIAHNFQSGYSKFHMQLAASEASQNRRTHKNECPTPQQCRCACCVLDSTQVNPLECNCRNCPRCRRNRSWWVQKQSNKWGVFAAAKHPTYTDPTVGAR